jgi:hypothetical protein
MIETAAVGEGGGGGDVGEDSMRKVRRAIRGRGVFGEGRKVVRESAKGWDGRSAVKRRDGERVRWWLVMRECGVEGILSWCEGVSAGVSRLSQVCMSTKCVGFPCMVWVLRKCITGVALNSSHGRSR